MTFTSSSFNDEEVPLGTQSCPTTPQRALQAALPPELFRQAVLEHAEYLGIMDPHGEDKSLLWIAERSLLAPLPEGWIQMSTETGQVYYFNEQTGESDWNHPCDEEFRNLFLMRKAEIVGHKLIESNNHDFVNYSFPALPDPPPSSYSIDHQNRWNNLPPTLPPNQFPTNDIKSAIIVNASKKNDDIMKYEELKSEFEHLKARCSELLDERNELQKKATQVEVRDKEIDYVKKECEQLKLQKNSLEKLNSDLKSKLKSSEEKGEKDLDNTKKVCNEMESKLRTTIATLETSKYEENSERDRIYDEKVTCQNELLSLRDELHRSRNTENELQINIQNLETKMIEAEILKDSVKSELSTLKLSSSQTEDSLKCEVEKLSKTASDLEILVKEKDHCIKTLNDNLVDESMKREKVENELNLRDSKFHEKLRQARENIDSTQKIKRELEIELLNINNTNRQLNERVESSSLENDNSLQKLKSVSNELVEVQQRETMANSSLNETRRLLLSRENDMNLCQIECEKLSSKIVLLEDNNKAVKAKVIKLTKKLADVQGSIRVLCRIRPLNDEEKSFDDGSTFSSIQYLDEERVSFHGVQYEFDHIFPCDSNQIRVFEEVAAAVETSMQGCNVCIFAYGQTGSGKSYTMLGPDENRGVNIRAIDRLFKMAADSEEFDYKFNVSILEVYNEKVRDVLSYTSGNENHEIRMGKNGTVFVDGISEYSVKSTVDVEHLLKQASDNRITANNNVNERSSRSHLVLICSISGVHKYSEMRITGKLSLIDLAGSERLKNTEAEGIRLKEAQNINRSLSALGDVIAALGSSSKHVPYRNSKLTFLLQDSLRINSKCLMFVNINPSKCNVGESICSLNFAKRCKAVNLGKARRDVVGHNQIVPKSPARTKPYPSTPTKTPTRSGRTLAF